jgi:hypothetical protein
MGDSIKRLLELVDASTKAAAAIILLQLHEPVDEVPFSNGLLELATAATKEVPRAAAKKVPRAAAKKVQPTTSKRIAKKVQPTTSKRIAKKVQPTTSKRIAKKRVAKGAKWRQYHLGDKILEGATVSCKWIAKNGQPIKKPFTGVVVAVNSTEMTVYYHARRGYSAEEWPHTFYDFKVRKGQVLVERS